MPQLPTRAAVCLTLVVLTVACAPQAEQTAAEPPNFTVAPAAAPDPGLLLTIMVQLGRDMSTISDALWREDLAGVATAAISIAEHPHVSTSERERIQAVLGDRFPDFVQGDQRVHHSAGRLAEHAGGGDMSATLDELAELQAGCVACHEAFREDLRAP